MEQKERNFEYDLAMEEDIPLTEAEQQWEKLIVEQMMEEVSEEDEEDSWLYAEGSDWAEAHSWKDDLVRVKSELMDLGMQRRMRSKEHGERLVDIWEVEKELRRVEKIEDRREKKALKRARKEGGMPDESSQGHQENQHNRQQTDDLADEKEMQKPVDSSSQSTGDEGSVPDDEVRATLPPKLVEFKSMRPEE